MEPDKPGQSPLPPIQNLGERTLAAIVFTDAVNFSARVGQTEDEALALVQRDLSVMSGLCQKFNGQVLKSTGDGLLMCFGSAVQAVSCAVEIQNTLNQKKTGPELPLQHRISIHLGDVYMNEGDVLGDGVNIAARLQHEAPAGGICLSQTVYDVVRNRISVKPVYQGTRSLKNISEPVPVYHLQIGEGPAPVAVAQPSQSQPWHIYAIFAVVAVFFIFSLLFFLSTTHKRTHVGRRIQAAASNFNQASAPGSSQDNSGSFSWPEFHAVQEQHKPKYEFNDVVDWLKEHGAEKEDSPGHQQLERYEHMNKLHDWLEQNLEEYNSGAPLNTQMHFGQQQPQDWQVWSETAGKVNIRRPGGNLEEADLWTMQPGELGQIMHAALLNAKQKGEAINRDVMFGAMAFKAEYGLGGANPDGQGGAMNQIKQRWWQKRANKLNNQ